jgi:hypothetical protein
LQQREDLSIRHLFGQRRQPVRQRHIVRLYLLNHVRDGIRVCGQHRVLKLGAQRFGRDVRQGGRCQSATSPLW